MIRWLWKIIVGRPARPPCARECEWEILDRSATMQRRGDNPPDRIAIVYTLRCKTCGDLKDHRSGL